MMTLTCKVCGDIVYILFGDISLDEEAEKWATHVATKHPDLMEEMLY